MTERVLEFGAALAEVLGEARSVAAPREVETVSLQHAAGRVLAAPVRAQRDQPPFDRSTRDGFALWAGGFALRADDIASELRVVGSVRAGQVWEGPALQPGEAIEIMTGAPLPAGADAVVMVEHVVWRSDRTGDRLRVEAAKTLQIGENIVPRGAEARSGDGLLPVGRVMGAAEVAVAASCGLSQLTVFARPKVAIVATGDELVELGESVLTSQIYNSNSYALAALVRGEGGFAGRLAIAKDTREDLWERIAQGSMWDLLVLSGGVSMGKFDLVEEVLTEFGAEFFFTGAKIQPGKPIVFGRLPKRGGVASPGERPWTGEWTYFFGLPGNPVSTQVCFHLFVAPMLRALAGRTAIAPVFVEAKLAEDVRGGARVTRFLPAELVGTWDGVTVQVVGWQGSGDVAANARGNCYCVLPAGVQQFAKGDTLRVLLR